MIRSTNSPSSRASPTPSCPARTVYFPVEQDCEKGGYRWSEIPSAGTSAHALKQPAPGVRLVAAQTGAPTARAVKAGALSIQTPWVRATPGGAKVAGGYVTLSNTGTEPDRLIGGTFAQAGASRCTRCLWTVPS